MQSGKEIQNVEDLIGEEFEGCLCCGLFMLQKHNFLSFIYIVELLLNFTLVMN